jgi:NodT family efflux transporter outer membrane factor (OMF) lipoprotein
VQRRIVRKLGTFGAALVACVLNVACTGKSDIRSTLIDPVSIKSERTVASDDASSFTWPAQGWWKRYGDSQLDSIVEATIAGSPTLKVAEARVRKAIAIVGINTSALLPAIQLNDEAARQLYTANGLVPKPVAGNWAWSNQLALDFSYDFDFWGKHRAEVESAVGEARATQADLANARLILVVAVVKAYLQLDDTYKQVDISTRELDERRRILGLTQRRVAAQIDSRVELKQAEGAVPSAAARLAALQSALAVTRDQLAALMGRGPDAALQLERPHLVLTAQPSVPANIPANLLGHRPDIVAQRWRVESAGRDIAVARAQFYPDISLGAFIGYQSLNVSDFIKAGSRITGIAPAMSLPLFEGGRLRANLAAKDASYDIAVEQYNQTVIDAVRQVVDQLVAMQWLTEQRAQIQLAVAAAQDAYTLALDQYRANYGNYLQVLIVDLQLLSLLHTQASLETQAMELDVNLNQSLGGGYYLSANDPGEGSRTSTPAGEQP